MLLSKLARAKTRRLVVGLAATMAAVVGLSLASAGPAAADGTVLPGSWVAYGTKNPITSSSSTWKCGATKSVAPSVLAQTCAIRSSSGSNVQGAVIVRNNNKTTFNTDAFVSLYDFDSNLWLDSWYCSPQDLAPGGWTVCFGDTWGPNWHWKVYVPYAEANSVSLPVSPAV